MRVFSGTDPPWARELHNIGGLHVKALAAEGRCRYCCIRALGRTDLGSSSATFGDYAGDGRDPVS